MIVLTNPAAGAKADALHELERALADAGVAAEIKQVPGEQIANAARDAMKENVDALVAAGGDGTVSASPAHLQATTCRWASFRPAR